MTISVILETFVSFQNLSWFYSRYKHTGPLQYLLKGEQQQADTAPTHAAEDPQSCYSSQKTAFKFFPRHSNCKDATSSSQVHKLYALSVSHFCSTMNPELRADQRVAVVLSLCTSCGFRCHFLFLPGMLLLKHALQQRIYGDSVEM